MEHYELADAFGRRLRPVLQLAVELRPLPDIEEEVYFNFLNVGRGIARHAGFVCKFGEGLVTGASNHVNDVSPENGGRPVVQGYMPAAVVHANGIFSALGYARIRRVNKGFALLVDVIWYAEDMSKRQAQVDLEPLVRLLLE